MDGWAKSMVALLLGAGCTADTGPADADVGSSSTTSATGGSTSGSSTGSTSVDDDSTGSVEIPPPWTVGVDSTRATRIEVWVYAAPQDPEPALVAPLQHMDGTRWEVTVDGEQFFEAGVDTIYYGFRAWGPNWPYDEAWEPGTEIGFITDVDDDGNRFNPNKLLLDPYARELSHDPQSIEHAGYDVFASGPQRRQLDSGPRAPKSIALLDPEPLPAGPARPLGEDVVYEAHVRGMTRNDPSVPEECRGTYAGAAMRAKYLAELGFTAVEFLPIHETDNDHNDREEGAQGDNYWGYSTLNYFAPDRRYACDKSPGGPTREFREMVEAFHAEGVKVYLDVVYNHTAETGTWGEPETAALFSLRGLDNAAYYELSEDGRGYVDNSGVGANLDVTQPLARQLVMDSLRYAHEILGVDGYRFDLAAVLGNRCSVGCFEFRADGLLTEIADEFARPVEGGAGTDLLAEPWGVGPGTYQIGNFPPGWAEWNGPFRDALRRDLNRFGVETVAPRELLTRMRGSPDLYGDDGRTPQASVNFLIAHDGFTLHDLYACNDKVNDQPWPYGPSDGGSDQNFSMDWVEVEARRKLARTSVAWLMAAAGVPMVRGGDEFLRSTQCNNNPYNVDSPGTWLDWTAAEAESEFRDFFASMIAFRRRHPALTGPTDFRDAARWFDPDANVLDDDYLDEPTLHFIAMEQPTAGIEGESVASIYFAYNGWTSAITATLPPAPEGTTWHVVADTASGVALETDAQVPLEGATVSVGDRSVVIAVAR